MADVALTELTKYVKVALADDTDNTYVVQNFRLIRLHTASSAIILNRLEVDDANRVCEETDYYLAMINLSASRTVTLPSGVDAGFTLIVKDASGLCATYNIIIDGNGNTVDTNPSVSMITNFESLTLIFDGVSNWEIN